MSHDDPYAVHALEVGAEADPVAGKVRWDPAHSLWNGGMALTALVFGPLTFSWPAFAIFIGLTGFFLLTGHSVGFHRRLIHGSFQCPLWLEHMLVYAGVLVGMSGPFSMIRAHDTRDWGQRQEACHPYLSNDVAFWTDYWWNLHCRLELERPPVFAPPPRVANDRFYRFLERTWTLHQIPLALALYALGGWGFVVWGVAARIAVSVTGHWFVGRLAHREGPQTWLVSTSGVQAHDVPWAALPTMGEAWHNNHHAWPGSARMGLYPGQSDWGFGFIQFLERLGLAWDVRTPETMPVRDCLEAA